MSDTLDPPRSRIARIATLLETYLKRSISVGFRITVFVASLYLLYIGIGITAIFIGWPDLSYPIFSLESDPFFVTGGAVVGLFVVQSSGSLVLYHIIVGAEDDKSQLVVLLGFISLGCGGALLRATLPRTIQLLATLI